jgi:hypothetical protein
MYKSDFDHFVATREETQSVAERRRWQQQHRGRPVTNRQTKFKSAKLLLVIVQSMIGCHNAITTPEESNKSSCQHKFYLYIYIYVSNSPMLILKTHKTKQLILYDCD